MPEDRATSMVVAVAAAGCGLEARVPGTPKPDYVGKEYSLIDLEADNCPCQAGDVVSGSLAWGTGADHDGRNWLVREFEFDSALNRTFPRAFLLQKKRTSGKSGVQRQVNRARRRDRSRGHWPCGGVWPSIVAGECEWSRMARC